MFKFLFLIIVVINAQEFDPNMAIETMNSFRVDSVSSIGAVNEQGGKLDKLNTKIGLISGCIDVKNINNLISILFDDVNTLSLKSDDKALNKRTQHINNSKI